VVAPDGTILGKRAPDGSIKSPGPGDTLAATSTVRPDGMVIGEDGKPMGKLQPDGTIIGLDGKIAGRRNADGSVVGPGDPNAGKNPFGSDDGFFGPGGKGSGNGAGPFGGRGAFGDRPGSRADTRKGEALILRLQEQLEDKAQQIKQRDERLKQIAAKNRTEKKALQKALNVAHQDLMDKQNKWDDKLAEMESERESLKDQIQRQQDAESERDSWKARAESAESSVKEMKAEKDKGYEEIEKLAAELKRQIEETKDSRARKEAELNEIYQIRWKDMKQMWEKNMQRWKIEFMDKNEKQKELELKELARDKKYLEKALASKKAGDLKDGIENEKLTSRLQRLEFLFRQEQKMKEQAKDELAEVKAEMKQKLEDLENELRFEKERRKAAEDELKMLQQKIIITSEKEVYRNTLDEFETSMDLQKRKRRRTSLMGDYVGRTVFKVQRPSNSPIPTKGPDGTYTLGKAKPAFRIMDFANHVSSGPFLIIENQTDKTQNLQGYSLKLGSKSGGSEKKTVFGDTSIESGKTIRIVTQETKNPQENDLQMDVSWANGEGELEVSLLNPDNELIEGPIPLDRPEKQGCVVS